MKHVNLLLACMLISAAGMAQKKGTLTFGANVVSSSVNSFDSKPQYEQNLQSRIGFFAFNNLAMGLALETSINKNKTLPYSFTFFSRYYIGKEHHAVKFFVDGGIGVAHHTIPPTPANPAEWQPEIDNSAKLKGAAHVGLGMNIFLTRSIAFELAPEYRYIAGDNSLNRLGAGVGLKFFISEKQFKKMFPHKFARSF